MEFNSLTPAEIQNLIIRFLRHESTPEEISWLEEWLERDPSNRAEFARINTTFHALGNDDPRRPGVDSAWQSLIEKIEDDESAEKIKPIRTPSTFLFLKIAASFLLLTIAGFAAWQYSSSPVTLADGAVIEQALQQKKKVVLPDGTTVWLNVNSTLRYEKDFNRRNRKVALAGEAYFDVTKTGIDFIVQTDHMSIQVKGTRFNVKAFDGEKECTTLEEGSVALTVNGHEGSFEMKPGDQITFNEASNELAHQVVNAASYAVWKEEQLVFEKSSLAEIVVQLEKRFQVNIIIDETIASREYLSLVLRDETLEEVLELIRISSSLHYAVHGDSVTIYE